ncbi:uncharacterized protein FIESC28_09796 [Fusarium coffeatum]|uniref:C2H2-type domain-containing protein n=1 Tax=Fusarium coffeatum TaxID=231269 RepID=A0A366QXE1_9HYPO|nr:uncharacterized protein FIESC28_09796 [Fusarium coffeatum]RBR09577.1 hypothetical protein FIESC28_09796 [Fusarium coffeatum]
MVPHREHIQRCHIPEGFIKSLICNRCHQGFLTQDLLVQHQRQEDACPIMEPDVTAGKVTLEQAAKLTAAKKKKPNMSDEMRWFGFYDIIFPGQDPAHRPSTPYHEPLINPTSDNSSAPASISISRYRDSFIGPSNSTKKRKLEEKLKCWGVPDPRLCRVIAAKVQEYQVQDLQDFMEASADTSNIEVATESNPPQQDLDGCCEFDFAQFNASDLFFDQDI